MSDRELAAAACDDAFKDGIGKMVGVLFQGWVTANSPAEQQQVVERFRKGLALHKAAHASAQQAITEVLA